MKTLEDRIKRVLREEASRLSRIDEALVIEARPVRIRRHRVAGWTAAVTIAVVVATPLFYQAVRPDGQTASKPATTTISRETSTPEDADGTSAAVAPELIVSEVADPGLAADLSPAQRLQEAIDGTGNTYPNPPGDLKDVAIRGNRIVVVTAPSRSLAGVAYSDGDTWTQVDYVLPEVDSNGESGEYAFDGFTDVVATPDGFVAWGTATPPISSSQDSESVEKRRTVFLVSEDDGESWQALLAPQQFTHMVAFRDGYLAVSSQADPNHPSSSLKWSQDLNDWVDLQGLGNGLVYAFDQLPDGAVAIGVHSWTTAEGQNPDGTTYNYVVQGSEADAWYVVRARNQ